jgi:hypothetical protein
MVIHVVLFNPLLIFLAEKLAKLKIMDAFKGARLSLCGLYNDHSTVPGRIRNSKNSEVAGLILTNYKALPLDRWNIRLIL